jgi:hypothetical protein
MVHRAIMAAERGRSTPSRSGVTVGYFANGFVFTAEPDFTAVAAALPDRLLRGYKHHRRPVWLLDLWKPRRRLSHHRAPFPFCDPAGTGFRTDLSTVDADTRDFVATFQRLKEAVGHRSADPEHGNVHLALAVATTARRPAFFFAADDEQTDMGCRTVPGSLVSFGCTLNRLAVHYGAGRTTVTPLNFLDDDNDDSLRDLIARVSRLAEVSVLPPRDIEGGQRLYENPVDQWPTEAGDPVEVLGLGTWDPLRNVERDSAVVFEDKAV